MKNSKYVFIKPNLWRFRSAINAPDKRYNISFFHHFVKHLVYNHKRFCVNIRSPLFYVLFITLITTSAYPMEDMIIGAKPASLAGAFTAQKNEVLCMFYNPAGIKSSCYFQSAFSYSKPFGLQDLSRGFAAFALSTNSYTIASALQNFGNNIYRENIFYLTLQRDMVKQVSFGVNIRYYHLKISKYGQDSSLLYDMGVLAHISPNLDLGFYIKNITYATLGKSDQNFPQILSTGLRYSLQPFFAFSIDCYKDIDFPLDVRFGTEFSPINPLCFNAGAATEPTRFAVGFNFKISQLVLEYAYNYHLELNVTHLFTIKFFIKQG